MPLEIPADAPAAGAKGGKADPKKDDKAKKDDKKRVSAWGWLICRPSQI